MATPRAILNGILFQFEEKTVASKQSTFKEKTEWGFELGASFDETSKKARWVIITSVGPDVRENLKPGMRVLVDALKWTTGFKVDGVTYWKTDEEHVLLLDEA